MKKSFFLPATGYLTIIGIIIISTIIIYKINAKNFIQESQQIRESSSPQRARIMALGRLEPKGQMLSIAGPIGERIVRLEVEEGDWVKPGQILAYLETYRFHSAQRDLAASRIAEIKEQIETDKLAAKVQIQQSKAQIQQIDQPQMLQSQSQKASLRSFQAELASANRTRDRYRQLYAEGAISRQTLEDKELAVRQALERVNQSQQTLNQLVRSRNTNLQKAKVDLTYTQANLARIDTHSGLASAIQQLKSAEAQLEQSIIRSPKAGKILKIFTHPGEAISQQGVLRLGDTRTMYAVAEVYETDVKFVNLGQRASITSPAFAKPLTGKVTEIGQMVFKNNLLGDDPTARSDVRVVEVKICLDQSQLVASLSQLQVDVQIDLSSTGALYVP
ncbi:cyclic nucleotide modulated ABC exporter membrane fusion protein [Calothrix sp. NIES-4101]|nr:cyclic nucleotide modulated ABC exporter membrane fusion protein [Calothrix sp. NIES-4101]